MKTKDRPRATDAGSRIMEVFEQLDPVAKAIVSAGVHALAERRITLDQCRQWMDDLARRHRAGEELMLSDLTPPGTT